MRIARFLALPALVAGLAVLLAACSGSTAGPGWTYAPPPPATAAPAPASSAAPSAAPSVAPSVAPSAASPGESPATSSAQPSGVVFKLVAQNIQFDQSSLEAPANQPLTIEFSNQDAGVPHNVAIKDAMGMEVFKGEIFNGVDTRQYQVPAPPVGSYAFVCTVHPNMTGTLTVK